MRSTGSVCERSHPFQQSVAEVIGQLHDQLLQEKRCCPHALRTLAATYLTAGLFARAKDLLSESLVLDPENPQALFHLGRAYQALEAWDEAIDAYQDLLRLEPEHASAHFKLGSVYRRLGRFKEASANLRQAIHLDPKCNDARFEQALVDLLHGDMARGFEGYEHRWNEAARRLINKTPAPLWLGAENLGQKTILLHEEQGFGDTLQFVRYLPIVAASGALVLLKVQPALRNLMQASYPAVPVYSSWEEVPAHDFHCPLPSLPHACQSWLQGKIPSLVPYLKTDAWRIDHWKQRLAGDRRPRVGVAWAGNPLLDCDPLRSIRLGEFRDITNQVPCRFLRLQKDLRAEDRHELDAGVLMEEYDFEDFSDTAALVQNLDLVVTVDTCIAHLAGALGKPVWVLVPRIPDWRWGLNGEKSSWYPSARLFRQEKAGDWNSLLSRIGAELWHFASRF